MTIPVSPVGLGLYRTVTVWELDLTSTTIKGNMQRVCSEAKTLPDTHQHTPLYTPHWIEGRWWKNPKWTETEDNWTIHHLDKSQNWFHETSPFTSIRVKFNWNTILCDGCVSVCLLHWCYCCVLSVVWTSVCCVFSVSGSGVRLHTGSRLWKRLQRHLRLQFL